MPDLLTDQLSRLAPEVDMTASRTHFEARRDGGLRFGSPSPRRTWVLAAAVAALLVAGVVALAALTRDDPATTPLAQPDDAATTLPASAAAGDEFELLLVEEVEAPFHELFVAVDQAELEAAWAALDPPYPAPTVDFDRRVAVVLTRPDNACPDTLTRFEVDGSTWTPVFAVETGGCNEPLLSWLYVVGVDRSATTPELTVSIPADELFGAPAASATALVLPSTDPGREPAAAVPPTPTDVVAPLPPVGEPELHLSSLGALWIVHHEDGTVSVLPAVVDAPGGGDEGEVSGLGSLVVPAADATSFGGSRWEWDAWGRTIGGPRTEDLAGFVGEVVDGEVRILTSASDRIAGDPVPPTGPGRLYDPATVLEAQLGPPIAAELLPTLSSILPVRHVDGVLVVENGVGRICQIDPTAPVPDLETCGPGVTLDTSVTSSNAEITTWYFSPLLVEFDEFGTITRVVPLGGLSSRSEQPAELERTEIEVIVESAVAQCRRDGTPVALIDLVAGADTAVNIEVQGDGAVLGRGYAEPLDGQQTGVEVVLDRLPSGPWTVRVLTADHGGDEMTSSSFDAPPDPTAC